MQPRHVWVDVTGQWGERAEPGILIAWRQVVDHGHPRWEGWVIHARSAAPAHGESPYVYQSWVDARLIKPLDVERPKPDLSRHRPVNG